MELSALKDKYDFLRNLAGFWLLSSENSNKSIKGFYLRQNYHSENLYFLGSLIA